MRKHAKPSFHNKKLRKITIYYNLLSLVLPRTSKQIYNILKEIDSYLGGLLINMSYNITQLMLINMAVNDKSIVDGIDTKGFDDVNLDVALRSQLYILTKRLNETTDFRVIRNALKLLKSRLFKHSDVQYFIDYMSMSVINEYTAVMNKLDVTPALFNNLISSTDKISINDVIELLKTSPSPYNTIYGYPHVFTPIIHNTIRNIITKLMSNRTFPKGELTVLGLVPSIPSDPGTPAKKQFTIGLLCDLVRISVL